MESGGHLRKRKGIYSQKGAAKIRKALKAAKHSEKTEKQNADEEIIPEQEEEEEQELRVVAKEEKKVKEMKPVVAAVSTKSPPTNEALKKQVRSILNKLSIANLEPLTVELENLFNYNSRSGFHFCCYSISVPFFLC